MSEAQPPHGDSEYSQRWEKIWLTGSDGGVLKEGSAFDAAASSPALTAALAAGKLGELEGKRVFVPGCGRGYDLVTFVQSGAMAAVGLELAPTAVASAQAYLDTALSGDARSKASVAQGDFFRWSDAEHGAFDAGYDYTFLVALSPEMRPDWAQAWARMLRPGGVLATLIFPVDPERESGPPWPVTPDLYKGLLLTDNLFKLRSLEAVPEAQSHPGRGGKEWMAVWERSA
jgi:SAM-dependent methyltransferase